MSVFSVMRENYVAARDATKESHYSAFWDMPHYPKFKEIIDQEDAWEAFLYNGIGEGMGIKLYVGKENIVPKPDSGAREITDKAPVAKVIRLFEELNTIAGPEFIDDHLQSEIGLPPIVSHQGKKLVDADLKLIFNAWRLQNVLSSRKDEQCLVVEIGGGYGSLVEKLRKMFPKFKFLIIDLPEANAIQTYFLNKACPDAKFFYLNDLRKGGISSFIEGDYNIALLPVFAFNDLPADCVDVMINIRSMMEMNLEVIRDYFTGIHKITKIGGTFYTANRYCKPDVGVPVRIKDFPFDERWRFELSTRLWAQPNIHELVAVRCEAPVFPPPKEVLRSLPPYSMDDVLRDLKSAFSKLGMLIFGLNSGMGNPGLLRTLVGLGENPKDPIARLRRILGRYRQRLAGKKA